ncbi:MAG: hypothetical protein KF753_19010 [Caldilineaceae bacterium]|nr:hypothetical protein [Caldilineaceae bacterium]
MRDFLRYCLVVGLLAALLSLPASAHAQQSTARLTCRFEPASIPAGQSAQLVIEFADVQNLYGYELKMNYDAGKVQVQDGDTTKEGINLQLGTFLSPDFVLFNTADNGSVQLALTQLAPATAKSGSGELGRVAVQGIGQGFANFAFGDVTLSDANGKAIGVTKQDCLLEIGAAGQPTPTATQVPTNTPTTAATSTTAATATPTTVAAATQTPVPPTPVPQPQTPTWTPTSTPTATPLPTESPTPTATVLIFSTPTPSADSAEEVNAAQAQPTPQPSDITRTVDSPPTPTTVVEPLVSEPVTPSPEAQESAPASTTEATPTLAVDGDAASTEVSPPVVDAVALVQPTQTATPTATPMKIAQVGQAVPMPVESIQQPINSTASAKPGFLRGAGWLFLFFTSVLAVVAWRMRKA